MSDRRALPPANEVECLIALPVTNGVPMIVAVSSGLPVSLRLTGTVNVKRFPANGTGGSASAFPRTGFTTTGFTTAGGTSATGVFAFGARVLSAGLECGREYPTSRRQDQLTRRGHIRDQCHVGVGASDESQSRLQRSFCLPADAQPGPRSACAETSATPAGNSTSTTAPVAGP